MLDFNDYPRFLEGFYSYEVKICKKKFLIIATLSLIIAMTCCLVACYNDKPSDDNPFQSADVECFADLIVYLGNNVLLHKDKAENITFNAKSPTLTDAFFDESKSYKNDFESANFEVKKDSLSIHCIMVDNSDKLEEIKSLDGWANVNLNSLKTIKQVDEKSIRYCFVDGAFKYEIIVDPIDKNKTIEENSKIIEEFIKSFVRYPIV